MISRSRTVLVASALAGPLTGGLGVAAAATRVALVRPTTASPAVSEALTRIEGELAADGFDVVLVDPAAKNEKDAGSGVSPDEAGAQASISFVIDTEGRTAELSVVDRLTNKAVVRRTPIDETDASRAAEVLAVRAVELLRASLLELMIEAEPPPAPVTIAASSSASNAAGPSNAPSAAGEADRRQARAWAAKALPARSETAPSRWAVEAGAGVLASTGGVGPAVIGIVRGRFAFAGGANGANLLAVRATLGGLGTQPRVDTPTGSANVAEDLGVVEIVAQPWPHAPLRPTFALGAGAMYTTVDGQASSPYVARHSSEWSAVASAGVGAELALGDRFAIALEVHALLAQPTPVVRFLNDEAARAGDPSILGTLTLSGSP